MRDGHYADISSDNGNSYGEQGSIGPTRIRGVGSGGLVKRFATWCGRIVSLALIPRSKGDTTTYEVYRESQRITDIANQLCDRVEATIAGTRFDNEGVESFSGIELGREGQSSCAGIQGDPIGTRGLQNPIAIDGNKRVILICEDSITDAATIVGILKSHFGEEYEYKVVSTLRDMMESVHGQGIKALICDLMLPDTEPETLVRSLRHTATPTILYTGLPDSEGAVSLAKGYNMKIAKKQDGPTNLTKSLEELLT